MRDLPLAQLSAWAGPGPFKTHFKGCCGTPAFPKSLLSAAQSSRRHWEPQPSENLLIRIWTWSQGSSMSNSLAGMSLNKVQQGTLDSHIISHLCGWGCSCCRHAVQALEYSAKEPFSRQVHNQFFYLSETNSFSYWNRLWYLWILSSRFIHFKPFWIMSALLNYNH